MMIPVRTRSRAWQPLTPRGVAAFAGAPLARLLLVQLVVAVLAAAAVVWFLDAAWFPTVRAAIRQLPARGEIRAGRLDWAGDSPRTLAEGKFLAITVDLDHSGKARSPAHVQVEFGRNNVRILSLLGYAERSYPRDWLIAFNRPELQPWWGAWEPPILSMIAGAAVAGLMEVWALLATAYCPGAWLAGFLANRELAPGSSWKLAAVALMPGALLMSAAILFYGLGVLDLVGLMAAAGAHVLAGWIYLVVSPFFLPTLSLPNAGRGNPFVVGADGRTQGDEKKGDDDRPASGG